MIRLYGPDNNEMMAISTLETENNALLIKGKIYGAMPLTARLYPEDARAFFKLMTPRLIWFLFTMLLRKSVKKAGNA